jgi:hypothetical protein
VAGARHEAFESRLGGVTAAAPAGVPGGAGISERSSAMLSDSLARLAAANEDVAAAEDHVEGA